MRTYVVRCIGAKFISETEVEHEHDNMVTLIRVAKMEAPAHNVGKVYIVSRNWRDKVCKSTKIG